MFAWSFGWNKIITAWQPVPCTLGPTSSMFSTDNSNFNIRPWYGADLLCCLSEAVLDFTLPARCDSAYVLGLLGYPQRNDYRVCVWLQWPHCALDGTEESSGPTLMRVLE